MFLSRWITIELIVQFIIQPYFTCIGIDWKFHFTTIKNDPIHMISYLRITTTVHASLYPFSTDLIHVDIASRYAELDIFGFSTWCHSQYYCRPKLIFYSFTHKY